MCNTTDVFKLIKYKSSSFIYLIKIKKRNYVCYIEGTLSFLVYFIHFFLFIHFNVVESATMFVYIYMNRTSLLYFFWCVLFRSFNNIFLLYFLIKNKYIRCRILIYLKSGINNIHSQINDLQLDY